MLTWNIAGMYKVRDLKDYLNNFDIIALQETWLEKQKEKMTIKKLDKGYKWIAKAAKRENKKGRAKGGVLVGIKKGVAYKSAKEWGYGIVISEVRIEKGKEANVIVVYNNGKIKEVIGELRKTVEELEGRGGATIIVGDLNARIGKWQINEEGEMIEGRSTADPTVNREGKKLLELCEEIGGTIKNGDTKGDWEGSPTYVGGGGGAQY